MNLPVWAVTIFQTTAESIIYTGSSRLMQVSLLPSVAQTTQTAQTEEFMFQNVAH